MKHLTLSRVVFIQNVLREFDRREEKINLATYLAKRYNYKEIQQSNFIITEG